MFLECQGRLRRRLARRTPPRSPHLASLLDDSELVRLGLVDVDILRKVCLGLYLYSLSSLALGRTLAREVWLRALTVESPAAVIGTPS